MTLGIPWPRLRPGGRAVAAGLLFGLTVVGPLWALLVEPRRLRVQRYALTLPRWPRGHDVRVAVVADLHAGGPHMVAARIRRIVALTNAQAPDVVLLLGDYRADHVGTWPRLWTDRIASLLSGLSAPGGVVAVLGDHDWTQDPAAQARGAPPVRMGAMLERHGIRVLHNDAARLSVRNRALWVAGLGDQRALHRPEGRIGLDDLDATLGGVPDDGTPVILCAHQPDVFPRVPLRVDLTVSGHTHGGQIRFGPWVPFVPSRHGARYARGHVSEGDRDLVVSSGLGCSGLPVRFGVVPEVVTIDIAGGATDGSS
ncbi:metallophosphoesterase [Jannaschia sp. LMIT008]|uniref:metallophosphoesterase n=1 Tax=Jannaschia maritima TaxID=3032585 RepID=UPI002811A26B|nr:metallophosphoesterase [Jannaschia sp. LMIT008]